MEGKKKDEYNKTYRIIYAQKEPSIIVKTERMNTISTVTMRSTVLIKIVKLFMHIKSD